MCNTRIYKAWSSMRDRCLGKNTHNFKNYGGRGITICDQWNNFENFYKDMSGSYFEGLTLDRIDVDGNYSKDNCRWITKQEQQNNRRNNTFVTFNGETNNLQRWSNKLGISYSTLKYRHLNGKSLVKVPYSR